MVLDNNNKNKNNKELYILQNESFNIKGDSKYTNNKKDNIEEIYNNSNDENDKNRNNRFNNEDLSKEKIINLN